MFYTEKNTEKNNWNQFSPKTQNGNVIIIRSVFEITPMVVIILSVLLELIDHDDIKYCHPCLNISSNSKLLRFSSTFTRIIGDHIERKIFREASQSPQFKPRFYSGFSTSFWRRNLILIFSCGKSNDLNQ